MEYCGVNECKVLVYSPKPFLLFSKATSSNNSGVQPQPN